MPRSAERSECGISAFSWPTNFTQWYFVLADSEKNQKSQNFSIFLKPFIFDLSWPLITEKDASRPWNLAVNDLSRREAAVYVIKVQDRSYLTLPVCRNAGGFHCIYNITKISLYLVVVLAMVPVVLPVPVAGGGVVVGGGHGQSHQGHHKQRAGEF